MVENITARLYELKDEGYRDFQCRLMPTVDRSRVIGVRTPGLRQLAREIGGTEAADRFIKTLPHRYYEENNLHAILISRIKDYGSCIEATEFFLPHVDNWATCDIFTPAAFGKNIRDLEKRCLRWLSSEHTYTIRFGMRMLMSFFLDRNYRPEHPAAVAAVETDEYYVMMMQAWYFATALAKRYEDILPFIAGKRLEKQTHNKAIQKAVESFRIPPEHKLFLRTLRRK